MEAPAGLASVSLALHGGINCRPPISRQGSKAGYSQVLLAALGLRSGQGAGAYLWAEADLDVAALLRCYPDAAMLRRVAEIIRGWASEEPRALWERLRAERKARGGVAGAEGTAGWLTASWMSYGQDPARGFRATAGGGWPDDPPDPETVATSCHRLAEYATIQSLNRLVCMADDGTGALMNTGNGGTRFGGEFATPPGEVADRFDSMAHEVASYGVLGQWSFRRGEPDSGFNAGLLEDREPTPTGGNGAKARTCEQEAGLWAPAASAPGWPPVCVTTRIPEPEAVAAMLGTPGDLSGCVYYSDPPYLNTTGYRHDLPRAEVVRLALGYAALGATVCVSEAEALPELVAQGWHSVEITAGRKGQRRTFSKQQGEFLTMNREPAHRIATQPSLFGAA
jgi:hypothetical protein